jgi:sugar phosphate isomerase/epimerase
MVESNPFAFSTVACPDWDMDRVIEAATEYGYQGVELRTFGPGSTRLASDPALTDPEKIRGKFDHANVEITCLATSLALHYKDEFERVQAMRAGRQFIDLASRLGCPFIRTFGYQVYPGELVTNAQRRIADRYRQLAEYAEASGVQILIENAGSFARARELWNLTNEIDHPLVGVCWNVANAAGMGERPAVSANALHSRIRYTKLKDTEIGEGTGFVPLGQGSVPVERFVEIMRGIGYEGYFCFEWDKIWLPTLADPEESLPQAVKTLHEWMRTKVDKKGNTLSKYEAPALEVKAE